MDESIDLIRDKISLITTAPYGFAGAGTIHSRILCILAIHGFDVTYVSFDKPFLYDKLLNSGVTCVIPKLKSDAYPNSDLVSMLAVIREILQRSIDAHRLGKKIVLMGTYIFPYYQSISMAAELLTQKGIECKTVAIPAGSDIWQIGFLLPELSLKLLREPQTNARVTYSHKFSREIYQWIGECGKFIIIPPPLNTQDFTPVSPQKKSSLRNLHGIPSDSYVILNCSNMRPIKCINNAIEITIEFSKTSNHHVILLLVGPITNHLQEAVNSVGFEFDNKVPFFGKLGNFTLMAVGLQSNTYEYHALSDVAINTSIHDSFNTSLAESMACGLPVITSDVAGISELINMHSCGHLFSYNDDAIDAFRSGKALKLSNIALSETVNFLHRLNRQPALGEELGRNGRKEIIKKCAEDCIYKMWTSFIRSLIMS